MALTDTPRDAVLLPRRHVALLLGAVAVLACVVAVPILGLPQLDADDYRYLHLVSELRAGRVGILQASIIENRWDHLWWIDCHDVVRFFRPTLMLSYLADHFVHGGSAFGLLLTNALLYLATCLLAAWLIVRVVPHTVAALLASLLFAGFSCHAETIWYVAGRNETLAALGFLGALACHMLRGRARLLALPCYAFALLTKELTLPLPLIALAFEWLVRRRSVGLRACLRADRALFVGYVAVAALYLVARQLVLAAAGGSDLVFPYFVAPSRPDFGAHVWHQIRSYGENLLLAGITPPFLRPDQIDDRTTTLGTILIIAVPLALLVSLRRERRMHWFTLLALVTWLPTCAVYVSERYLFLPSFGLAGMVALALARAERARVPRFVGHAVVVAWLAHQTYWLHLKNTVISQTTQVSIALQEKFASLRATLPPGQPIYVLNFPADTFSAQFLQDLVRVVLGDPTRACRVLTVVPDDPGAQQTTEVRRIDAHEIEVRGRPLLMAHSRWLFPWTKLDPGAHVERERLGFAVTVSDGQGDRCQALRLRLPHALDDAIFVRFSLPPAREFEPRGDLIRRGGLDRVRP